MPPKRFRNQLKALTPMTAQPTPSPATPMVEKKNSSQFVGFQIAGQEYAFRIEQIQEIVILDQVTKTPQVPDYVEGVSNLRGSIIPIINLRKLFGLEPKPTDSETRTIVVNVGQRTMGCRVDMVSQVVRIPRESIQPAPETVTADGAHYISGFAKLEGRLMILLDIDELLDPKQLDALGSNTKTFAEAKDAFTQSS
jgi:purine-binding chemotaxis protein CheW